MNLMISTMTILEKEVFISSNLDRLFSIPCFCRAIYLHNSCAWLKACRATEKGYCSQNNIPALSVIQLLQAALPVTVYKALILLVSSYHPYQSLEFHGIQRFLCASDCQRQDYSILIFDLEILEKENSSVLIHDNPQFIFHYRATVSFSIFLNIIVTFLLSLYLFFN